MKNGLVTLPSPFTACETVARLFGRPSAVAGSRCSPASITAQMAKDAGLHMAPACLVIFGSPQAGTPLMRRAPTMAIDLPFKALVWEGDDGVAWLSYNDPEWLAQRHGLRDPDVPKQVWEYEEGAVAANRGNSLARSGHAVSATTDPIAVMSHALSEIAADALRPRRPVTLRARVAPRV